MDTQNNVKQEQTPAKNDKTLFGVLSYIGPLVIISLLVKKVDPFIKFHIKQGLVLLSIEIILYILGYMLWSLWPLYNLLNLVLLILSIIGIMNVVQNKEKELPLVGGLASYFPV
jgi:uncharacterized membrane protein